MFLLHAATTATKNREVKKLEQHCTMHIQSIEIDTMHRLATVCTYPLPYDLQLTRSESDPITCHTVIQQWHYPLHNGTSRRSFFPWDANYLFNIRTRRVKEGITNRLHDGFLRVKRKCSHLQYPHVHHIICVFSIEIKVVYQQIECETTTVFFIY